MHSSNKIPLNIIKMKYVNTLLKRLEVAVPSGIKLIWIALWSSIITFLLHIVILIWVISAILISISFYSEVLKIGGTYEHLVNIQYSFIGNFQPASLYLKIIWNNKDTQVLKSKALVSFNVKDTGLIKFSLE